MLNHLERVSGSPVVLISIYGDMQMIFVYNELEWPAEAIIDL